MAMVFGTAIWPPLVHPENLAKEVRKAVERSTLDQEGNKPFHLKAAIAPSFERDKDSGRTGEVEIWWASPTQWKRDVRSPTFHQIEIVNGSKIWQKNEGDFFPEWLRETAVELIKPVPPIDQVLEQAKNAEQRHIGPMTTLSWTTPSGTPEARNISRSWIAFQGSTGLLLYAGGLGWGGEFKDYASFHERMIAKTVNVGSPQVTAKVTILEDLGESPAGFFDPNAQGGDPRPLHTLLIDENSLRKNLLPTVPVPWPPLQDGLLEGNFTTVVVVDREGKVREIGTMVSENSAINDAGRQAAMAMRFTPFLVNGDPVQVISQVTIPFKTVRPSGGETFETARTYFERGRHASFPAAGNGSPYVLRAEFEAKGQSGIVATGRYEDTWLSAAQWRREVWFENSHYLRCRNGQKSYESAEGPEESLLRLTMKIIEPIPAIDAFYESDWRIRRDTVDGFRAVRVLAGYESPEGKLDPEQARGYWFDDTGLLLKTYFNGLETQRSEFQDFAGAKVAHRIDVLRGEQPVMRIRVEEIAPAEEIPARTFEAPGHEWKRAFTAEVR
jgi:Gram-negative bacterial TonB protein C-terminal